MVEQLIKEIRELSDGNPVTIEYAEPDFPHACAWVCSVIIGGKTKYFGGETLQDCLDFTKKKIS